MGEQGENFGFISAWKHLENIMGSNDSRKCPLCEQPCMCVFSVSRRQRHFSAETEISRER